MNEIVLENIEKRYGTEKVVHGIDLEIRKGEFVVLLGPSGCGKTTTLRMIAGLEDVSAGQLYISGNLVNNVAPRNRGVAMVFQNYALYPHMNVRQNMEFALRPMKLSTDDVNDRITKTAELLDLSNLLDRRPAQLSGGQRQRVAMARAMVRSPKVFLFDEPLSNLDAMLRTRVRWEIAKLHDRTGATVIYVTHDQIEAMTLADKIVLMRGGHVEQVGSPEEVYTKPKTLFVANFIGSPPINLIKTNVQESSLQCQGLSVPIPANIMDKVKDNQQITIGIRPVDIILSKNKKKGSIAMEVMVSEFLGTEALLDMKIGDLELVAQVSSQGRPETGDKVNVSFNYDQMHFFDSLTGDVIEK